MLSAACFWELKYFSSPAPRVADELSGWRESTSFAEAWCILLGVFGVLSGRLGESNEATEAF